jgi:hypothetical protein
MLYATLAYVLVSAIAALATPALGSRRAPFVIWVAGALVLIAVLVRTARGGRLSPDRQLRWVFIAVLVGASGAFAAFVVMVNVLERLGIAH